MKKAILTAITLCLFCLSAKGLSEEACIWNSPSYLSASHREGKGIGYPEGYTTLAGFLTPNWDREVQPFLDVRAHLFNNSHFALNAGAGLRAHLPTRWALGYNFYYDFRDTTHLRAHQISGGFEALRSIYEIHLDGYYPVGSPRISEKTQAHIQAIIALPTIFGEFGIHIPTVERLNIYFGAGPYYIVERTKSDIDCGGSIGARTRLKVRLYDGIDIEGIGTFDGTFHAILQGRLSITYPLGPAALVKKGARWKRSFSTAACKLKALRRARMQQPTDHNEIIPICKKTKKRRP